MIQQLQPRVARGDESIDLQIWISYCTFDIIGALSFGEDFGCVDHDRYHEWMAGLVYSIKAKVQEAACRFFPWLYSLLVRWTTSPQAKAAMIKHMQMARERIQSRLQTISDHSDFLSRVLKAELSDAEQVINSATMIFAGSQILQTTLSGIIFMLLKNPHCLSRVINDVREAFGTADQMTARKLAELPYLSAVLQEGFRMISPVPLNMTRLVPDGGAIVAGEVIPAQTIAAYMAWAANYSLQNFAHPETFDPDRWLDSPSCDALYKLDHKDACLPFFSGPRDCLGQNLARMEIFHIIARLLLSFDMSQPWSGRMPLDRWEDQEMYAVWERTPLPVRLSSVM